jgi:raffinose/stachyose/melibiose transport system permease protein
MIGGSGLVAPPGEPRRIGYLYLAPGLLVFGAFVLVPLGHAFWLSLFEWDGVTAGTWIGLDNYGDVVSDPALRRAFWHALVLIGFYALLPVAIGLLLAGLLARASSR